jgi:hypothetical protein
MTNASPVHNPADDYPPTRPNRFTLIIALALVLGMIVIIFRSSLGL